MNTPCLDSLQELTNEVKMLKNCLSVCQKELSDCRQEMTTEVKMLKESLSACQTQLSDCQRELTTEVKTLKESLSVCQEQFSSCKSELSAFKHEEKEGKSSLGLVKPAPRDIRVGSELDKAHPGPPPEDDHMANDHWRDGRIPEDSMEYSARVCVDKKGRLPAGIQQPPDTQLQPCAPAAVKNSRTDNTSVNSPALSLAQPAIDIPLSPDLRDVFSARLTHVAPLRLKKSTPLDETLFVYLPSTPFNQNTLLFTSSHDGLYAFNIDLVQAGDGELKVYLRRHSFDALVGCTHADCSTASRLLILPVQKGQEFWVEVEAFKGNPKAYSRFSGFLLSRKLPLASHIRRKKGMKYVPETAV